VAAARLGLVTLALVLTGRASTRTSEPTRWQTLADEATTRLGAPPALVTLVDGSLGQYNCKTRALRLGADGNIRWLAHELGHHLSRSCGGTLDSEMTANAWAVRVLQAWGDTEAMAVRTTVLHLVYLKRRRGDRPAVGHDYCAGGRGHPASLSGAWRSAQFRGRDVLRRAGPAMSVAPGGSATA
jgi:hypothetical protein